MIMRKPLQTRENGVELRGQETAPGLVLSHQTEGLAHHFDMTEGGLA